MSFLDFFRSKASIHKRWTKKAKAFADHISEILHLEKVGEESFHPATLKWQFPFVGKVGGHEKYFRLDVFRKNELNYSIIGPKVTNKFRVMLLEGITPALDKYYGFLYECKETVEEYVTRHNLKKASDREAIVIPLLSDIVEDLLELRRHNLYHSDLSFASFNVYSHKRGRVGAFESLVPYSDTLHKDLSDVQHLPPEALRRNKHIARNIEAEEAWCLGSLLLNILIGKSISGPNFELHTKPPSRDEAYNWIMNNHEKLFQLLQESDLSDVIQRLILRLLDVRFVDVHSTRRLNLFDITGILKILKRKYDLINP